MPTFQPEDLARWAGGAWTAPPTAPITAISHDSRTVQPGAVYVALRGARFDGHGFVEQAMSRGAVGAVVCRNSPVANQGGPALLVVEDTAVALRALAAGYRDTLPAAIIAVTGSTGKTTVKELIADMLSTEMQTARSHGNWNNEIGLPLSLLDMDGADRAGVFEVGISHPGEMDPLCALLKPLWGVITNVGPVHLEFFDSLEAIALEKGRLLRSLPGEGVAVLSADDKRYDFLRGQAPCRTVSVSTRREADYYCLPPAVATGDWRLVERESGEDLQFRMPIPGAHNRSNGVLAVAVARHFGVSWDNIRAAIEHYVSLPMRWEESGVAGVMIINDAYNANPLNMRAAIETFQETAVSGGKWLVLGDMLELGKAADEAHLQLGKFLAPHAWAGLVVLGPLAGLIADGAEGAGLAANLVHRCRMQEEAASVLAEHVASGDALLFKASRAMHLEDVIRDFRDRIQAKT